MITQDELDKTLLPNPRLTMAIPHLAPVSVAKVPKIKLFQKGLWGRVDRQEPETNDIEVKEHNCGSHQVEAHQHKVTTNSNGNKNVSKNIKTKKGKGTTKHSVFPKLKDDCSVQLACSLHIQELRDCGKGSKQ